MTISNKAWRAVAAVLRVTLGAVFAYAAYLKLAAPWQLFAGTIADYELFPSWSIAPLARFLPGFELVLGLLLIAGLWTRYAGALTALLMGAFFALMVRSYALGMEIDCGCFGPDGDPISWRTLVRDGALLVLAIGVTWMYWKRRRATVPVEDPPKVAV